MNRLLGTKWFTFYTKVRPWFVCLTTLTFIGDFMKYTDVYISNWWLLLYFAAAIAHPVLCVMVTAKSNGDYINFVRFVKGVLLFETINMTYQQGVQTYVKNDFQFGIALAASLIMFLISYFVWYRLNVKYFEKRILLTPSDKTDFTTEILQERYNNKQINITPQTNKIQFCRKCGEKLIDNSKFCHKCGTNVVTEPVISVGETANGDFSKKCTADISNDTDTCHVCEKSE